MMETHLHSHSDTPLPTSLVWVRKEKGTAAFCAHFIIFISHKKHNSSTDAVLAHHGVGR